MQSKVINLSFCHNNYIIRLFYIIGFQILWSMEMFSNSFLFKNDILLLLVAAKDLDGSNSGSPALNIIHSFNMTKVFQVYQSLVGFLFPNSNWIGAKNSNPSKPNQNYPYNFVNFLPWLHLVFCFILCFIFICFGAETFQDYADSVYGSSTTLLNIFNGITIFLNREKLFNFICDIEKMIYKRKQLI